MSQTAKGTVSSQGQNRFIARFVMPNGQVRTYNAAVNPPITNMTVNTATLTWSDDDQLVGADSYTGTVGTDLNITLGKGPTIKGTLQQPVNPTQAIVGNGDWAMTM
ncbi:uncharacterized protein PHACADRAFT_199985 [Phanerochaete carnosa HHB-10118-sp]|uniref:Uncharacterized protein n=1 Tax=Phanerochaete carnosa (strain HHB-10118-sp) TaxID=650164 RepID=K5WLI3_PHACS|nr:uncharacterized protein PHACADRAFT_199985 [Phanerochaete carnosa HHB-10118-sp]EKM51152.1 hypothetical protein PHACADRAFT_199985 [Phanerochaete carnosa HHB-10118-sp]